MLAQKTATETFITGNPVLESFCVFAFRGGLGWGWRSAKGYVRSRWQSGWVGVKVVVVLVGLAAAWEMSEEVE